VAGGGGGEGAVRGWVVGWDGWLGGRAGGQRHATHGRSPRGVRGGIRAGGLEQAQEHAQTVGKCRKLSSDTAGTGAACFPAVSLAAGLKAAVRRSALAIGSRRAGVSLSVGLFLSSLWRRWWWHVILPSNFNLGLALNTLALPLGRHGPHQQGSSGSRSAVRTAGTAPADTLPQCAEAQTGLYTNNTRRADMQHKERAHHHSTAPPSPPPPPPPYPHVSYTSLPSLTTTLLSSFRAGQGGGLAPTAMTTSGPSRYRRITPLRGGCCPGC
jgi:hypothetical protein